MKALIFVLFVLLWLLIAIIWGDAEGMDKEQQIN